MATSTSTGKKSKRRMRQSGHSMSKLSSDNLSTETKKGSKKKERISTSLTDPSVPPLDVSDLQPENCTGKEEVAESAAKSRQRYNSTGHEAEIHTSGTGNCIPELVVSSSPYPTDEDEGIGVTPRSSNNSDIFSESDSRRKPNTMSMSSNGSSTYPGILENDKDEEDGVEEVLDDSNESIEEEEDIKQIKQEKNPSAAKSIYIAPTLQQKQDVDQDSDATPLLKLISCDKKTLQAPSKIFQAPRSSASIGDSCPLCPMEPQEVTSDGASEYAENPGQLPSLDDNPCENISAANAIVREATVAIVRDNFDRIQNKYTKILYRYSTEMKQLKNEHKTLKKQHQTEKNILHQEIQYERAEREKETAQKCTLASHLEKLQRDTKEFQETKDKVESLMAELRKKEEELQRLRTDMLVSQESLREHMPPVQAGEEQMAQMVESEECLKFLLRLRPDKKKIEEELRRYEYRTQKRPCTT